jgi:hypothetical protein
MRDLIAPALHELGFTGRGPRMFRHRRGPYEAVLWTRKSMASTRHRVRFWMHLAAVHLPARTEYWTSELPHLVPGDTLGVLTISAGQPAGPRRPGCTARRSCARTPGHRPAAQTQPDESSS